MPTEKRNVGNGAENFVAHYMDALGYKIIAQNYSFPPLGEIDIIAKYKETLFFVEVKARSNKNTFGGIEGCISSQKMRRIKRCADIYIQKYNMQDYYCKTLGAFVHITPQKKYDDIKLIYLD